MRTTWKALLLCMILSTLTLAKGPQPREYLLADEPKAERKHHMEHTCDFPGVYVPGSGWADWQAQDGSTFPQGEILTTTELPNGLAAYGINHDKERPGQMVVAITCLE